MFIYFCCRFWCELRLPLTSHSETVPRCPFCYQVIEGRPVRLIFQHKADEDTLEQAFAAFRSAGEGDEENCRLTHTEFTGDMVEPSAPVEQEEQELVVDQLHEYSSSSSNEMSQQPSTCPFS